MMLRVGVVGCGAIGSEIARAIDSGLVRAELVGINDARSDAAGRLARSLERPPLILPLDQLVDAVQLVVEATAKDAAPAVIRAALERGRDVVVLSVGGLLGCADEACALAEANGARIYVPSGAIAGLDAVKAAAVVKIDRVTLTTRKPPRGLAGAPHVVAKGIDLASVREPTQIFSGAARDAIPAFPANVNVAAALSLAGIGADATRVQVVADPTSDKNVHEIEVEGEFGRLAIRIENVPSPANPKTSYMAALSAIALLRRLTATLVVGT
jgi:aspartate dehydrogenase